MIVIATFVLGIRGNFWPLLISAVFTLMTGAGCVSSSATGAGMLVSLNSTHAQTDAICINRAESALRQLCPVYSGNATVHILHDARPAAYSWSTGKIFLTTGLLELLDDTELSAAIAHELGHILDRPVAKTGGPYTLDGWRYSNIEERADAVAVLLLRASRIRPVALAHVLAKVRDAARTPTALAPALNVRIALIPEE